LDKGNDEDDPLDQVCTDDQQHEEWGTQHLDAPLTPSEGYADPNGDGEDDPDHVSD
jgi:hypothetical protein